jgi:tetratricopeptide (TPR) repeat protein
MWRFTREHHAEARRLFQAAVAADPQFARAHAYLAVNYLSTFINGFDDSEGLYGLAREAALRALALDDKEPVARFLLGRVYTQLGQVDAGLAELEEAVRLNPSFAQAHLGLGMAFLIQGRWEEARDACATAARLSPHDPMMPAMLSTGAAALALGGRLGEAEALARASAAHPMATFWSAATLASILGHLGRTAEARGALARLLELRPDFSEATLARFSRIEPDGPSRRFWLEGLQKAGLPHAAVSPP